MNQHRKRPLLRSLAIYPWLVVLLLWFCGFFNYADRQAVYSVFPLLEREFGLTKSQIGPLGSAFMIVYACASPLSGYTVDLLPRRLLDHGWALDLEPDLRRHGAVAELRRSCCSFERLRAWASRSTSRRRCRSWPIITARAPGRAPWRFIRRASIWEQPAERSWRVTWASTSAGDRRSGCWDLRAWPMRCCWDTLWSNHAAAPAPRSRPIPIGPATRKTARTRGTEGLLGKVIRFVANPAAALLLLVFVGANFVAGTFLTWLPSYIFERFETGLWRLVTDVDASGRWRACPARSGAGSRPIGPASAARAAGSGSRASA